MATSTTATERVNWRVIFGTGPEDRQKYIDYGDGSWLSQDAEVRARRFYAYLVENGVQACLTRNDFWVAGDELFIAPQPEPEAEPVMHKTRTFEEEVGVYRADASPNFWGEVVSEHSTIAHAVCTCGWKASNNDSRRLAQVAARAHRKEMEIA
jgi:hypothetical protein